MTLFESLIFEKGLSIKGIHFYPEMNLMVVVLNNRKVIEYPLSNSNRLGGASMEQLNNFELMGKGAGIHWPGLDEDISLKGLLQYTLQQTIAS